MVGGGEKWSPTDTSKRAVDQLFWASSSPDLGHRKRPGARLKSARSPDRRRSRPPQECLVSGGVEVSGASDADADPARIPRANRQGSRAGPSRRAVRHAPCLPGEQVAVPVVGERGRRVAGPALQDLEVRAFRDRQRRTRVPRVAQVEGNKEGVHHRAECAAAPSRRHLPEQVRRRRLPRPVGEPGVPQCQSTPRAPRQVTSLKPTLGTP